MQFYASRLESDAERQIEEVTSLLEDMSCWSRRTIRLHRSCTEHRLDKHIKREVDEMANKVLRGASKVFEFAKSLADIHPVASVSLRLHSCILVARTLKVIRSIGRDFCDQRMYTL